MRTFPQPANKGISLKHAPRGKKVMRNNSLSRDISSSIIAIQLVVIFHHYLRPSSRRSSLSWRSEATSVEPCIVSAPRTSSGKNDRVSTNNSHKFSIPIIIFCWWKHNKKEKPEELTWNDSVISHSSAEKMYVKKRLQWIVLRKQRSSLQDMIRENKTFAKHEYFIIYFWQRCLNCDFFLFSGCEVWKNIAGGSSCLFGIPSHLQQQHPRFFLSDSVGHYEICQQAAYETMKRQL